MMNFAHRDLDDLKTKIHSFRVSDLQSLCASFGRSRNGKKQDLQNRALDILRTQPSDVDIMAFKRKIYELYRVAQDEAKQSHYDFQMQQQQQRSASQAGNVYMNPGPYTLPPQTRPASNTIIYQNGGIVSGNGYPNTTVYPNPIHLPIIQPAPTITYNLTDAVRIINPPTSHTNISFKALPFYRVRHEILRPSIMKLKTIGRNNAPQVFQVSFVLTCDIASDIAMHRDYSKNEYSVQAQLRICAIDNSNNKVIEYDDMLPLGLIVRINDKQCALPPNSPCARPNVESRRIPLPINVTPHLKLSPMNANKLTINWTPEVGRTFVACVNVVEKLSSNYLLDKLKEKPPISVDITKEIIAKQYKRVIDDDDDNTADADDDDITPTIVRVSLQCPLAKFRMMYPAKGKHCGHLQCFDGYAYISCNEKKSVWMCPVCNRPLHYEDLLIDQYFVDVLASEDSSSGQEVQIFVDGSWKIFEEENVTDVSEKPKPKNASPTSPDECFSSSRSEVSMKQESDQKHAVSDNAVSTSGISASIPDSFVDLTEDDDGEDEETEVRTATDEQAELQPSTRTEDVLASNPSSHDPSHGTEKITSPVPVPDQSSFSLTTPTGSSAPSPPQYEMEPISPGSPAISLRINTSASSTESIEHDPDLYSHPDKAIISCKNTSNFSPNVARDTDVKGSHAKVETREEASVDVVMTETLSGDEDPSEIENSIKSPNDETMTLDMQVSDSDVDEDMPMEKEPHVSFEDVSTPENENTNESVSSGSTENPRSPIPNEMANLNIGN